MDSGENFEVTSRIWLWRPANAARSSGWHFLTIDGQAAAEIRFAALGRTGGFGSIKVEARIGGTRWATSIFPQREGGGFILPIKAQVRKAEGIGEGDEVRVVLTLP
ncbi:DUF1905 domain-containing protein [Rhizorhabdus dicambivorans]|uniref:DUF1905 domain-containing protein n=1 Tax=Rhizorhabdus dicambivorans TaxID=1850238 RepID=A0A2A4G0A8_9SPHN|nr:DUF1905 domain-containing protein [Rhizorhabdus dicambivorans]ATE63023.1 DUF1905 domain-containing protein [Rhizorhabdus dicambivorans]PCE43199.1 DUF1905 domain-containing protein [Rhizorhabdus dicambivorans]